MSDISCKKRRWEDDSCSVDLSVINCPVCIEQYDADKKVPLLMLSHNQDKPCGHTVCDDCYDKLQQSSRDATVSCPLCRSMVIKAIPNLTMFDMIKRTVNRKQNEKAKKRTFDIITDSRRWTNPNSKDLWEYLNKIGFLDIGDLHYLDDEHVENVCGMLKKVQANRFRSYFN